MNKYGIKGIAVKNGVSLNKHNFLPEELVGAGQRAQGKNFALLKDHQATVDNTIGRVSYGIASLNALGETVVPYNGFSIDESASQKIDAGVITQVSIGAYAERMVQDDADSDVVTPIGLNFMELSITPTPAVDGTSIMRASVQREVSDAVDKALAEKLKQKIADSKNANDGVKEAKMEKNETVVASEKVDYAAELAKVQDELAKAKLEAAKKELEALKANTQKTEVKAESKSVSTASAGASVLDGYIVETLEDGKTGVRKARPKLDFSMLKVRGE